jgi:hypothetical protein
VQAARDLTGTTDRLFANDANDRAIGERPSLMLGDGDRSSGIERQRDSDVSVDDDSQCQRCSSSAFSSSSAFDDPATQPQRPAQGTLL